MLILQKIYMAFLIILSTVLLCWANQKIESQVGPFILADTPLMESQIVLQFGEGYVEIDKVDNEILSKRRSFYSLRDKVWVQIQFSHVLDENLEHAVEGILITKEKLCDEKFKPKKSFGPLITSRGIQIGDSIDKVLSIYGEPSISIVVGKDDKFSSALLEDLKFRQGRILRYLPNNEHELLFNEFYFNESGLHSILISESE